MRVSAAPSAVPIPTLAAYAEHWLDAIRGTVREHTRERYRYLLTRYALPSLGALRLTELTRQHVRFCLSGLLADGLAPLSVRAVHAVVQAMLNSAVDDDLIEKNVALRLARRLHRRVRERPALDLGQLDLFLTTAAEVAPKHFGIFVALASGGLRVGEVIGLQPTDIDPRQPFVHVRRTVRRGGRESLPKSGYSRRVRVTEHAARILRAVPINQSGWLFPGRKGPKPIGYTRVAMLTKIIAQRAGLPPMSPKTFRRSYAAVMKTHGASLAWIADQFGHGDETVTARNYTDGVPATPPAFMQR